MAVILTGNSVKMCIRDRSYIHMDPEVDVGEMKDGYGLSGKTEAGKPKVFSGDWWNFWTVSYTHLVIVC